MFLDFRKIKRGSLLIFAIVLVDILTGCARRSPITTATPVQLTSTPILEMRASNPKDLHIISGRPQVVVFFAFWCGNSRAMYPILKRLEAEYFQQINFIYLDIDDPANTAIKNQLGYRLQPEFYLVDANGNVLKHWLGLVNPNELETAIKSLVK